MQQLDDEVVEQSEAEAEGGEEGEGGGEGLVEEAAALLVPVAEDGRLQPAIPVLISLNIKNRNSVNTLLLFVAASYLYFIMNAWCVPLSE